MNQQDKKSGRPTKSDLIDFCIKMESVMAVGMVPVVSSLEIVAEYTTNKTLAATLLLVKEDIMQGDSLAKAMEKYPNVFPRVFTTMIYVGECSGSLETVLLWLADYFKQKNDEEVYFKKMVVLPVLTTFVLVTLKMAMSGGAFSLWYLALMGLCAILMIFQKPLCAAYQKIATSLGGKDSVFSKEEEARILRALALALGVGLSFCEALENAAKVAQSPKYQRAMGVVAELVSNGSTISGAMKESRAFSAYTISMIGIAEEIGNVEKTMDYVADFLENEVKVSRRSREIAQESFASVVLMVGLISIMSVLFPKVLV